MMPYSAKLCVLCGESLFLLTFGGFAGGMPRMKHTSFLPMLFVMIFLTACSGMPQLFWDVEDDKPDYTRSSGDERSAQGRAPLNVPPELRQKVSVPEPDQVAVNAAMGLTQDEKKAIAGKEVRLDARVYDQTPGEVFSAVVDGMTSLNLPVESVDSPSGTITTDWIRKVSKDPTAISAAFGVFGGGPIATRHRFIVRIFRMKDNKTQLQIRTLAQQLISRQWVFKGLKRKVADELFIATEERLGMLAEPAPTSDDGAKPKTAEAPAANP